MLALPTLLVTMDLSVLFLALPALTRDLEPSSAELLWITDIYGFLIAGSLITMGALGDRIGRRRLLLIGAGAFAGGSLVAAFATSATMLIFARALLGIAGGTLAPSSLSLIRTMFEDERQRTTAIGIWISCFAGGAALGPLLGGVLLERFWWGSVFLANVPVMALLLALGPRLLPEFRDPAGGRIDVLSAALSVIAMLGVIYGVKRLAEDGVGGIAAASVAGGLVLGSLFVARQRALADPLIDLALFRAPAFSGAVAANLVATFVVIGTELLTAQYLQLVLGMGPLEAGLWSLPLVGGIIAGSMLAPLLVRRVRPAHAVAGGLVVAAAGLGLLSLVDATTDVGLLATARAITGLGIGPVATLGADLIVGSAPPEQAGAASGISETGTELGGALGIAILGSIAAAVYRTEVADSAPAGADAAPARDTLGGAVEVAAGLPGRLGTELLDAAHAAFAQALQLSAILGCATALCTAAAMVAFLPRRREPASEGLSE